MAVDEIQALGGTGYSTGISALKTQGTESDVSIFSQDKSTGSNTQESIKIGLRPGVLIDALYKSHMKKFEEQYIKENPKPELNMLGTITTLMDYEKKMAEWQMKFDEAKKAEEKSYRAENPSYAKYEKYMKECEADYIKKHPKPVLNPLGTITNLIIYEKEMREWEEGFKAFKKEQQQAYQAN